MHGRLPLAHPWYRQDFANSEAAGHLARRWSGSPRKSGVYDIIGVYRCTPRCFAMTLPKDAFRRFQEELAALDKQIEQRKPSKQAALSAMERAREDFLALKERYKLSVADVIAFFPEEEGIAYLQGLIAQSQARPRRGRKPKAGS